jgi:hypothetical protein
MHLQGGCGTVGMIANGSFPLMYLCWTFWARALFNQSIT